MAFLDNTLHVLDASVNNATSYVVHSGVAGYAVVFMLCVGLVWSFPRKDPQARKRLLMLLVFPALWMVMAVLGGAFAYQHGEVPVASPGWVAQVHGVVFFAALFGPIIFVYFLRGARLFAGIFVPVNAYVTFFTGLMSACSLAGACL